MTTQEAFKEIAGIEAVLTLLPDIPGIYPEWKRVVSQHHVQGVKIYDARLAALMNVYSLDSILTSILLISSVIVTSQHCILVHCLLHDMMRPDRWSGYFIAKTHPALCRIER